MLACIPAISLSTPGCRTDVPPNVILITVDTLRADWVGRSIAGREVTPNISALARKGTLFTAASSVGSETSPGTAGILSGLLPMRTGVFENRHMLPEDVPTMADHLRVAGFRTAAVVTNPVLLARYGFGRGFEHYEVIAPRGNEPKARARAAFDRALDVITEVRRSAPLFLWVHLFEPHGPYQPAAEDLSVWQLEDFVGPSGVPPCPNGGQGGWRCIPAYQRVANQNSGDSREYLRAYAGEVRSLDRELGRFLSHPRLRERLDHSLLILTADHGEALAGDHNFFFSHGHQMTQDQIAVPLIVVGPGFAPKTVANPVSTVDIFPTVTAVAGIDPPAATDGRDLRRPERQPGAGMGRNEAFVRSGDWKLRVKLQDGGVRLFHLGEDPGETLDRAAEMPVQLEHLGRLLAEINRRPVLARAAVRGKPKTEETEHLRSLGYL